MPCIFLRPPDPAGSFEDTSGALLSLERQGFRLEKIPANTHQIQLGVASSEAHAIRSLFWNHWRIVSVGPIWAAHGTLERTLETVLEATAQGRHERAAAALRQLRGSFALVLIGTEQTWVYGDPIGGLQLFRDRQSGVIGSSFLSLLEQREVRHFDDTAVLQYLLAEAPHGGRTLIEGMELLPPGHLIALHEKRQIDCWSAFWGESVGPIASLDEAVERIAEHLCTDFKTARCQGFDRASVALSGGFDSRLVLGLARQSGISSEVFVYGEADSSDVRVAQAIGQAEGLHITHVDKRQMNGRLPLATPVDASMDFFDGYSADGFLDRGADRLTRLNQAADGRVILNGGGGEILRNFFHLGSGSLHPIQIVDAFYSQNPGGLLRFEHDRRNYRDSMATAIAQTHSSGDRALDRREIELLYPLFRCRWWMSRNSSIANRTGPFLTPLLSPEVIRLAASLNLSWKRAGALEAALMSRIDPALSRHPSSYGFSFSQGPGASARLRERLHEARPVWSRPIFAALGYQLRQRNHRTTVVQTVQQPGWIQARWFSPGADLSDGLQRRVLSLQALADRFGVSAV